MPKQTHVLDPIKEKTALPYRNVAAEMLLDIRKYPVADCIPAEPEKVVAPVALLYPVVTTDPAPI
jgi:hypothetical protein